MDNDLKAFLAQQFASITQQFASMEQRFTRVDQQFQAVREEMAQQFQAVREETAQQFQVVREETAQQFQVVREETARQFQAAREESARQFQATTARLGKVEDEIRYAHVAIEGLRGEIQMVAEGVANANERADRRIDEVSRKVEEVDSRHRTAYQGLDGRVRGLEEAV